MMGTAVQKLRVVTYVDPLEITPRRQELSPKPCLCLARNSVTYRALLGQDVTLRFYFPLGVQGWEEGLILHIGLSHTSWYDHSKHHPLCLKALCTPWRQLIATKLWKG